VTWLKLSDDFPVQCTDLGSEAFRLHIEGLCWAMQRENGGWIRRREVKRLTELDEYGHALTELLEQGYWVEVGEGYQITHHMEHQPEPDVIAKRRESDAERKRHWRRKQAGLEQPKSRKKSRRDTTSDKGRDETRDPGRVGTGRDGSPTEGGNSTGGRG